MSSGKDFYVELRKQVTAIQAGVERAGMYVSVQNMLHPELQRSLCSLIIVYVQEMLTLRSP